MYRITILLYLIICTTLAMNAHQIRIVGIDKSTGNNVAIDSLKVYRDTTDSGVVVLGDTFSDDVVMSMIDSTDLSKEHPPVPYLANTYDLFGRLRETGVYMISRETLQWNSSDQLLLVVPHESAPNGNNIIDPKRILSGTKIYLDIFSKEYKNKRAVISYNLTDTTVFLVLEEEGLLRNIVQVQLTVTVPQIIRKRKEYIPSISRDVSYIDTIGPFTLSLSCGSTYIKKFLDYSVSDSTLSFSHNNSRCKILFNPSTNTITRLQINEDFADGSHSGNSTYIQKVIVLQNLGVWTSEPNSVLKYSSKDDAANSSLFSISLTTSQNNQGASFYTDIANFLQTSEGISIDCSITLKE